MNKKVILSLTVSGLIIGCFPAFFSFLFYKKIDVEAFVLPLILSFVSLSLSEAKEKNRKLSLLFFVISILICLIERGVISLSVHKGAIGDSAIFILIGAIPFFLFTPFFIDIKKNRSLLVFSSILIGLMAILCVWHYSVRYVYLYEWVSDWNAYKTSIMLGSIAITLAVIAKLSFDTKRNYLSYLLVITSGICYGVGNAIKLDSYPDFIGVIEGCLASVLFWGMLFSLIILVTMETNKEKEYERRNIIFKDIVYQELKPIKKRKRIITFEVPPNVPKFKYDLTHKMESENINSEQSDN